MALYDVVHKETGEKKQITCSVHEITQWYEDNHDWHRDWSEGCAMAVADTSLGNWKSRLASKNPGWKHVLDKVKNTPKSNAKDLY